MATNPTTDSSGYIAPPGAEGMMFADIGSSGLRQFSGWIREEFLPQLQGRQAARVFREMSDNSPTVGSIIFAITQQMRKVEWRTIAADESPEAQAAAEFADSLRFDMSHTFEDFIIEACSMIVYGFAPHEIVFKRRLGRQSKESGLPSSKFSDGLVGLRRLPIRGQDTIIKWFLDQNGQITGLTQQPWIGPMIDIPIEKLLLFRAKQHKNNPEGVSVLRQSYRPYYFQKRLEEMEAIMLERFSGVPVMTVPGALLDGAAGGDGKAMAALNAYKALVRAVKVDEQMGLVLPSDCYMGPTGVSTTPMYDFKLVTPSGGKGTIDFDRTIARHKLDILTSVLADWLTMGHEARGTQKLADTKVDMFFFALEGWLDSISSVLNRYLLPRIWEVNGFDLATLPQWQADMPRRIDIDTLGAFLVSATQAGMTVFPNEELENFVLQAAGLPALFDDAAATTTASPTQTTPGTMDGETLAKVIKAAAAKRLLAQRNHGR